MPTVSVPFFLISSMVCADAAGAQVASSELQVTAAAVASRRRRWFMVVSVDEGEWAGVSAGGREGAAALDPPGPQRERPAQHEVDRADDAEDDERLEGRVVDDLAGACDL